MPPIYVEGELGSTVDRLLCKHNVQSFVKLTKKSVVVFAQDKQNFDLALKLLKEANIKLTGQGARKTRVAGSATMKFPNLQGR